MSRDLRCSVRTVQRWDADAVKVPPGVYADIKRIATERLALIEGVIAEIDAAAAVPPTREPASDR
ncbi:hypothetical protein NFI95_15405 [Acetobacteraceae bacterium KSS8]|uniref:Uncharacterized protein n=1 Tax=Endosaccharibacter trunci TaxID=2812733 RepID=A0ABT1WAC6_9PROT|nr:hypothetical protein [Acetobacteraceae bacterium KSS8]